MINYDTLSQDQIGARQADILADVIRIIRNAYPNAVTAQVSTSDQNRYGFVLDAVQLTYGGSVTQDGLDALTDQLWPAIDYLNWNGVVRECEHGDAVIDLTTGTSAPDCRMSSPRVS